MARPRKADAPDTTKAISLTVGAIERLTCRTDQKAQAFLRDTVAPGLRVRVTNTGAKSFVFEAKLRRQTIRRTIGDVKAWSIEQARAEARRLAVMLDGGTDPREVEKQQQADAVARQAQTEAAARAAEREAVTVGEVWTVYLAARKDQWGDTHYNDHIKLARAGGEVAKRGTRGRGTTIAMPLHALMGVRLVDLDTATVETWAAREAKTRPTSARLAWRLLKVFLNWCAEQDEYAPLVAGKNAAGTRKAREALGKPKAKRDALLREQLPAWFKAVRALPNPTIAAALQTMLMTGARPSEVLAMRWEDLNLQWRGLTIRDKVEGERVIPLTPYVQHLLSTLPRRNAWVFASTRSVSMDAKNIERRARRAHENGVAPADGDVVQASASGHISEPRSHHATACASAGIDDLTLHGLRRSFKSLTEWLDIPAGVVAQIMGHKPSATAEKHYTVRPLDLLRVHHERIEAWILEQAGAQFVGTMEAGKLRAV
ncbi:MAG: preprotein translocase [Variovorax paradoxus]|nr:MAG: preprotein translocase [Variovorax paradoxus]PZQ06403.1 MAG: preprotein translocase [Variovorax paradoxus]